MVIPSRIYLQVSQVVYSIINAKCAASDHPVHAPSFSGVFALHSYIMLYPMILIADNEGPEDESWVGFRAVYITLRKHAC